MQYSDTFIPIVTEIDRLMSNFPHTKKDIGYGYRWTFLNEQRVDLIDYKKQGNIFLRVGRGAWLVRRYPLLYGLFDQVLTVIAKLEIKDIAVLQEKHIVGVFELLEKAPKGIGAFER